MADDNQIIGSVAVQIEADASDLQGQFDAAVQQATAAGGQIAQGINTGSQGFDSLSTAAGEFTSVISGLKALGIASTIEEIGSSSLEAYASLQKATIALTSLTGSAAQAQDEIAGLRTMAQDDALSFPSLVNANQRFTALGVAAGQIPSALTAAANAAAAMNSSFEQTSNAMERIVSSGTLSARVLVQLGINLQDVASAMGVSSADVVKDFKAITDEGQRLDILTDAMSKLQGTAEAVADSLSGSFQRVQNTMLTTFQQIGESIAPAAKDLADLAQVIIPEVGQAVQGLAAPAVSIVEFGKALTEAKDSIGSFVDSASGIPGLFKEIETAASNSGASFSSLVPGMDLVTEGFHSLTNGIEAYTNQGSNIVTMGNLIVDNLARQTTAIKVGGQAFQDAMKNSTAFIGAEGEIDTATTKIVTSAQAAQKAYQDMSAALANNTKDAAGNVVSANDVANAYDNWQKKLAALNDLNPHFADTVGGVTKSINDQQQVINTLTQTILQLMAAQDGSAAKAEALVKAQAQLSSALQSVVDAAKGQSTAIVGTGEGYTYMGDQAEALVQKQRDLTLSVQQAKAILDQLNASTDTSKEHQQAVTQAIGDYVSALQKSGAAMSDTITINVNGVQVMTTLGDAVNQLKTANQQLQTTMENGITVIRTHEAAMSTLSDTIAKQPGLLTDLSSKYFNASDAAQGLLNNQKTLDTELQNAQAVVTVLTQKQDGSRESSAALAQAIQNLISIQKEMPGAAGAASDAISQETTQLNQLKSAADGAAASLDNADRSMKAFTSGASEGLGSTDATGLGAWALSAQIAGLTTFAGSGSAVNSQGQQVSALTELQAAEQAAGNALAATTTATNTQTSATTALTTSTTAATSSTAALNTTINNLSTSANNSSSVVSSTTDSVTGLTTVIGAAAPVVDFAAMSSTDLGTSIQSLNSQLLNAGVVVDGAGLSAVDYANKLQSTVDNMNASAAAVDTLSKASTSAASNIATAATVIAEAGQAVLQSATGSGPSSPSAALTSSLTALGAAATPTQTTGTNAIPVVLGTYFGPNGLNTITGTPGESLAQALAAMFPGAGSGSFSMQSAIAQTPGAPFGANASPGGSQTPVTIQMNYPQFNSQQQSNKVMSDMIANLRTVAGQKL